MQLVGAIISNYKSIDRAEVPLEGLTVLFGPNGAGKTNLLEAIGYFDPIVKAQLQRISGARVRDETRVGFISQMAVNASGDGLDSGTFLEMLGSPWALGMDRDEISDGIGAYCGSCWWLEGGDLYSTSDRSTLATAYSRIFESILVGAPVEFLETAKELVGLLFDEPLLLIQEDFAVELTFDRQSSKAPRIMEIARDLTPVCDGVLSHLLGPLTSWTGRWPPLLLMSRGPRDSDERVVPPGFGWFSEQIGGIQVVSGDAAAAEGYLVERLTAAHDQLLHQPEDGMDLFCEACICPDHGGRVKMEDYDDEDVPFQGSGAWLEESNGWARPRPSLSLTLRVIERLANQNLPIFVADQGKIRLAMRPPTDWGGDLPRCKIEFDLQPNEAEIGAAGWDGPIGVIGVSYGSGSREPLRMAIADLGAGIRRWVATAVRIAVDACAGGEAHLFQADDDGAASEPVLELFDTTRPRVLLIDEPEQHLHPQAQRMIAEWSVAQSRNHHAVLLATHSSAFLGLPPEQASICQVTRRGHATVVQRLKPIHGADVVARARDLGFELGMGRDALAQFTRGVVVVEGEWDRKMLHFFFGRDLAEQRLLVVPLQGSDELAALADAAVIPALGLPVIALLDDVRAASAADLATLTGNLTKAERGLRDLAVALGEDLHVVRYEDPDVICGLPDAAVIDAYPHISFPGWDELLNGWMKAKATGETEWAFKHWALHQLGLPSKQRQPTVFFNRVLDHSAAYRPRRRFADAAMQVLSSVEAMNGGASI